MSTPARDQAIDYGLRLFRLLFKRMWLPLDERLERIVVNFIDLVIAAAAERMAPQRRADDELDDLADDGPLFPLQERYQTVKLPRRD